MAISVRCAKCGGVAVASADDVNVEVDFVEKKIRHLCPKCKTWNIMDVTEAKDRAKIQPLPGMRLTRG